jgi:hypothetical protein
MQVKIAILATAALLVGAPAVASTSSGMPIWQYETSGRHEPEERDQGRGAQAHAPKPGYDQRR